MTNGRLQNPLYSIIIPTYNEKDNIGILIELIRETFEEL